MAIQRNDQEIKHIPVALAPRARLLAKLTVAGETEPDLTGARRYAAPYICGCHITVWQQTLERNIFLYCTVR